MKKKVSFENLNGLKRHVTGLEDVEVERQRQRFGPNEIVESVERPWIDLIKDTIKDPMIWFLFGIGTVFFVLGDKKEALILFFAIFPLLLMDAFLHWRTQASTAALKGQLKSDALVIRGGKQTTIASHDIVPGDVVLLSSQQNFIPADGIWEDCEGVQVDESMLTGEAFPIAKRKSEFDPFSATDRGEVDMEENVLGFAGTRVLTGQGRLRVLCTGRSTSYGEIVQSVSKISHERTPLQISISKLVQFLIYISAGFCLFLAGIRYYQGYGWLDALLSAATLAVAAIPEEFPVVFTFFLGVGVFRLAKRRALVRRAVSVENIGRVTRICTDKTGTITIGQLKLTHVDFAKDMDLNQTLNCALSASDPAGTDPVDQGIQEYAAKIGLTATLRMHVFPFTEDRKKESAFVTKDGKTVCYSKGSPEVILASSAISDSEKQSWLDKTAKFAREGRKVLACAMRETNAEDVHSRIEPQSGFKFCGLLAFEDPPRPEVLEAMEYSQRNGIQVMMITGDHPETATAIARQVGLGGEYPKVLCAEDHPEKFDEHWLNQNATFLSDVDVVARCNPLQKLRIVNALRKSGDLVAVTGDGVNDVPALKAADIGIAMGIRGTRSAKEVASIILSDDNFSTIVNAIMEGRQLFANLKMSFEYLLLFHIPFVLTAAIIPLLGYPLLYLPVHIVWLELIIHPSALFAFQQSATDKSEVEHRRAATFFSRRDSVSIFIIGFVMAIMLALIYVSDLSNGVDANRARAKILILLSLWSAGLVLILSRGRTVSAKLMVGVTVSLAVVLVQVPFVAEQLHLTPLQFQDWGQALLIVALFVTVTFTMRRMTLSPTSKVDRMQIGKY